MGLRRSVVLRQKLAFTFASESGLRGKDSVDLGGSSKDYCASSEMCVTVCHISSEWTRLDSLTPSQVLVVDLGSSTAVIIDNSAPTLG